MENSKSNIQDLKNKIILNKKNIKTTLSLIEKKVYLENQIKLERTLSQFIIDDLLYQANMYPKADLMELILKENPSEEEQYKIISISADWIKYINNPSEAVQIRAYDLFISYQDHVAPTTELYIENPFLLVEPSEAVISKTIERHIWAIEFINNPSEELQLKAIGINPLAIRNIKNPSEKVMKMLDY